MIEQKSDTKDTEYYEPPSAEVTTLLQRQHLLTSLSLNGDFEDWELDEEAIDLEESY